MMTYVRVMTGCALLMLACGGCVLTRVATVPMRIGGAACSVVPGAGDAVHGSLDTSADQIDKIPF